ncbi:substrate-binding domain-containing protein [Qingshengfaniella alkalisoli]|nr:substrate-binding domain-containing protein [Qingshengfaniella alkalisoli]
MATLKDISNHLGISVTQVSRALNGHSDVSEVTRVRVMEAAEQLRYRPNLPARALVSGRSAMVGLVSQNYSGITTNRNFLETVTGLSLQFSSRDMQFVLHIAPEGTELIDVYDRLIHGGSLGGFVIIEPYVDDPCVTYLQEQDVPLVVHGRTVDAPQYPYFDIDNHGLAVRLTEYLIGLGHRRIALINGLENRSYARDREIGYCAALRRAGLSVDADLIRHGRMTEPLGLVSTVQMCSFDDPPTAILCSSTLIVSGVYKAAAELGLSVPDDLSVVAHDDDFSDVRATAFDPPLTVTRAPLSESWAPLAEYLTGRIRGRPLSELQSVGDVEFIERGSATSPKKG